MPIPADGLVAGVIDGPVPARFWQRYAAWSLDAALLAIPTWCLTHLLVTQGLAQTRRALQALASPAARAATTVIEGTSPPDAARNLLADPALADATQLLHGALLQALAIPAAVFTALALLWHVGFERSSWRGSPGKRALQLVVTDVDGGRPAPLRCLARFVAGGASWLTFNLGHALAALPPRHLALHDRLSATRVLAAGAALPRWARVWLLVQLLALVAANLWLVLALQATMQAALERALN